MGHARQDHRQVRRRLRSFLPNLQGKREAAPMVTVLLWIVAIWVLIALVFAVLAALVVCSLVYAIALPFVLFWRLVTHA
jgi:fatty acid desaturase